MKRLFRNKDGEVSYGQKWQHNGSGSDSEKDDDSLHSPTITNQYQIPKGKKVEVTVKDGHMMYVAALQGDWVAAEVLLGRDQNLAFDYLTEEGDRALHVAAALEHKEFVKKLVERMSEEELVLLNGHGYTACCYAAISGNIEIARLIIGSRPKLVTARDEENATPLRKAALQRNNKMLKFLLGYAKNEDLSREEWFDLLLVAIRGKMFGEAVYILGKNGSIATMANEEEGTALHLMARVHAFREMSILNEMALIMVGSLGDLENKYYKFEINELTEKLWGEMQNMERDSLSELMKKPVHIIHEAAKAGQVNIITMLNRSFPALMWETDCDGYTIFHLAVMYRQRDVFNLVYHVKAMLGSTSMWKDRYGNNILHLAAKKSADVAQFKLPPNNQLRGELKWFQDVKEIVPTSCSAMRNGKGLKPEELLSKTHKKLLKDSETRMINKADSLMLISTILLTVVFAAAFTVPGGYSGQTGEPVLGKKKWFKLFVVFEVLSMHCSIVSIIMFQSILASSFAIQEFLSTLPFLQKIGFQALLMSLAGAFLAFMASILLFDINMTGLVWFGFATLCIYGTFWALGELSNVFQDTMKTRGTDGFNLFGARIKSQV